MDRQDERRGSLDLTPDEFRSLGYRAVDLLASALCRLQERDGPARCDVPSEVRKRLLEDPLPREGRDPRELLEAVGRDVLPYPLGQSHPRFFAWVNPPAAPLAVLGELLAAGMNSSVAGGDQAATYVEHAVLSWLKEILGFPNDAGALLVSGGSLATIVGLAVMRHVKAQTGAMRTRGLRAEPASMIVYTSTQAHSCIDKAVELLGIGSESLRRIPVDADYRMDVDGLAARIAADRRAGLRPVAVVASAGTVNTGAIDPLDRIADLCEREDLWLHVDGAYGGVGVLSEAVRPLFSGMERADSLGIDPHKWLYIPAECGCIIVRDAAAMQGTFSAVPPYLQDDRALPWFSEFGPQQTRGFRALKLWFAMKQVGVEGYRALVSRDIALAARLREKIAVHSDLELVAGGPLGVTCFRYAPAGAGELEALNRRVLRVVQQEGKVYVTSTLLDGRFVLRANVMNFRTTEADLDALLEAIVRAGRTVRTT
jgi:aromatic-L-amino-acid/L-tryptophan decarboxylase